MICCGRESRCWWRCRAARDSVALLRVLRELGYAVRAFHLNHCLRGAESDRDEAFCRALCAQLGVELTVERVDVAAAAREQSKGVEETARRIRYARLHDAAQGDKDCDCAHCGR